MKSKSIHIKLILADDNTSINDDQGINHSRAVANEAFESAKLHFEQSNSLDTNEKAFVTSSSCIEYVQQIVFESLAKYEAKREFSKPRKWLQKASESICHYAIVLDVFIQHHPEYVALVWGTMKLLFIVNNDLLWMRIIGRVNSLIHNRRVCKTMEKH